MTGDGKAQVSDRRAWCVAPAETGELAREFIDGAIASQGVAPDQLTLHADRGTSMTSKPVAQLLVDLGAVECPRLAAWQASRRIDQHRATSVGGRPIWTTRRRTAIVMP